MLHVDVATRRASFSLEVVFQLTDAGVIGLFGRSGSGKTTLINLVAGLMRPQNGRIALDDTVWFDAGQRIDVPPERRHIGYVFQDPRLFPHLDVNANLRYALRRTRRPAYVTLDEVVALLDLGSLMDRRTQRLSGGEAQRVSIGRALLTQPRLLLLDEPLAGLDGARRDDVLPYLEALRDHLKIPMVYVSHRFDEVVRLATHIVLLESGKSIAQGDVGAMSRHPNLRAVVGPDEVSTILDVAVRSVGAAGAQSLRARVGHGDLTLPMPDFRPGGRVRLRILAREVIVATREPLQLSVRHILAAVISAVCGDQPDADASLITLDVGGGTLILARVTRQAAGALSLQPGMPVWAIINAVAMYACPDPI